MGMRDQSWCASCGAGMLYTEDENVTCYRCDQEEYNKIETKSSKFLEYMKIHKISLEQDKFKVFDQMLEYEEGESNEFRALDYEYNNLAGQIEATEHLLSVATDIMNSTNERYE
jgi:hypothetical protein